ncbi:hypothetical protein [Deinococcus ruber]|uniref:DUF4397 domain-containing protein n=1 Tax=Deinococcus ruber TaxID=1848197 RepID=A0A918F811_9DEIO|nr:hypothetical protein [Deinococcus ruber]GGR17801.1 hypothetical protein GCM10008957_33180 [Deinococcus ruber]
MKVSKCVTALFLTASLLSVPAFAQQTTPSITPISTQASVDQGLDLYVNGTLVASGALAYSNTIITLGAAGLSTITAYQHGASTSTGNPVYSSSYHSTMPDQVIHLVIGGTYNVFAY